MRTTMRLVVAITMVLGVVLGVQSAAADQLPLAIANPTTDDVTLKAEQLEREARELFSEPKRYGQAVKLLQEAATEREIGDPARITDLHLASRLSFYKGDESKALQLMAQAASEALAVGDVIVAAHHFADAAFLAKEANRPEAAAKLAKKSTMLANSPLIGTKERAGILARVQVES